MSVFGLVFVLNFILGVSLQGQRVSAKGQEDGWDGMHGVKTIKSIIKDRLNKQSTVGS